MKKPAKAGFLLGVVLGLGERQVRNSDLTQIVSCVTEAACCVGKFDVTITSHEANYWFKSSWIQNNARTHQWNIRAVERGCISLA